MGLMELYQQIADGLQDNPIQRAGQFWAEHLNPIYDGLKDEDQFGPVKGSLAQIFLSALPLTGPAISMGQMSKYSEVGDLPGMGITGLSAALSPFSGVPKIGGHVLKPIPVKASKAGVSKLGSILAIPDAYYELPEE